MLSRGCVVVSMVLAACVTQTPSAAEDAGTGDESGESGESGESDETGSSLDDLPEDETDGPDDPTGDPPDDPAGDPTGPGASLPAYGPNCGFVESPPVAFAPLHSSPETDNDGGLQMGPCGHVSTGTELIYPDGSVTPLGGTFFLSYAPTGEIATTSLNWEVLSGTVELFDLAARTRRSLAVDTAGFIASFANGVASRVWTCQGDRLEVHDGTQTWLLDEGLDDCEAVRWAEAAPILLYRRGGEYRVVDTDTGVITNIALDDAPQDDCSRELTVGYDGDAIAQTWLCEEWIPGQFDEPELTLVFRGTSLYSVQTGLRLLDGQSKVKASQVPVRGGAWWFSRIVFPVESVPRLVYVLVDGELTPLLEDLTNSWISADGTVFVIDHDSETNLGTLLRSDDGGFTFVSLGSRPGLRGSLEGNWEGTAIAGRTYEGNSIGLDLWAAGAWQWQENIQAVFLAPGSLFADGAMIVHEDDNQRSSLRSPTNEILVQWDEVRTATRLDARMVLPWGRAYPELILGGVALLASDGTSSPLVPESEQSAPWAVTVAPAVGIVAAWMTDGNQRVLWYGRPQ